jgi:hypothetical protein
MYKSLKSENAALKKQVQSLKRVLEKREFQLVNTKRQLKFWCEFASKNYPETPTVRAVALLENLHEMNETSVAEFEEALGPWLEYKQDFDILSNREIERRLERSEALALGNKSFIEAVASWRAAGKPRAAPLRARRPAGSRLGPANEFKPQSAHKKIRRTANTQIPRCRVNLLDGLARAAIIAKSA